MIMYGEITNWQGNEEANRFFALLDSSNPSRESAEATLEYAGQWNYGDNYGFTHTAEEIGLNHPAVTYLEDDTTLVIYDWDLSLVDIYGKIEVPE